MLQVLSSAFQIALLLVHALAANLVKFVEFTSDLNHSILQGYF